MTLRRPPPAQLKWGKDNARRPSSRQALPRLRYPCRKGHVHMALRRLTSSRPLRPGVEGLETMSADSWMLHVCPSREERSHKTLCRHALPCPLRPSEARTTFNGAVLSLFTPLAPSAQRGACAHDIAPSHFTPPAPSKWGRAAFTGCRAVRLYHACVIRAGKGALT